MFYQSFIGKTCFPLPITLQGDFTSNGTIVKVTVANQLKIGDNIYSTLKNELRKILSVLDGNTVKVDRAFTDNVVTAEALKITDRSIVYSSSSVSCFGGADGILNGNVFPVNAVSPVFEKGAAFTIDATGTRMGITGIE